MFHDLILCLLGQRLELSDSYGLYGSYSLHGSYGRHPPQQLVLSPIPFRTSDTATQCEQSRSRAISSVH